MKVSIVRKSIHHGNTEKIAKAIANVLEADLFNPEQFKQVQDYDLIGFGSGIYHSRHHESLFEMLDSVVGLEGKKVFLFSTAGMVRKINHASLKERLIEKGAIVVDEFSCFGHDTYSYLKYFGGINKGKPDEKDLQQAEKFAAKIKTYAS